MAAETVDTLRVQGMRADRLLSRNVTADVSPVHIPWRPHLHQMKPVALTGAMIERDPSRRRQGIDPTDFG